MTQSQTISHLIRSIHETTSLTTEQAKIVYEHLNYAFVAGYESSKTISATSQKIRVRQYDKAGNHINDYRSMLEAARYVSGNVQGIQQCVAGKKLSYKGYFWIKIDNV